MHQLTAKDDEKLFHAAISQSGSLHSSHMSLDRKTPMVEFYKKFSDAVGCPVNQDNVVQCLLEKSAQEITEKAVMFDDCNIFGMGNLHLYNPKLDANLPINYRFSTLSRQLEANFRCRAHQ